MDDLNEVVVTTCRECNNELSDAKYLPCSHTFCSVCLETICHKTIPGSQQPCPQCKQPFRVPTQGCRALPDNPYVAPLQRLRAEMVTVKAAARRLDQLNRSLEADNIEAGSRCVEHVIRATEAASELEARTSELQARLEAVELDRDEARLRLQELELQQLPSTIHMAETEEEEDSKQTNGRTRPTPVRNSPAQALSSTCRTVLAMFLVLLSAVIASFVLSQRSLMKEMRDQLDQERFERKQTSEQLERERSEHENELATMRQRHSRRLQSMRVICGGEPRLEAAVNWISTFCGSSFINSFVSSCCYPTVTTSDVDL